MGGPTNHHFVPKFLLKNWKYDNANLWLYLKNDIENSPKSSPVKKSGQKNNLYTSTGGDKSVETDFFGKIDDNASTVLKKIIEDKKTTIDNDDKKLLIHFINTFHSRSPELMNLIKNFNKSMLRRGEIIAEKNNVETNPNHEKLLKKEHFDDSPKIMRMHSTIGEKTAMSKHYENDYNKLLSSEWMIYENKSSDDFIVSDFPLQIIQLSSENSMGFEIPRLFGMILPLSPRHCLIISNAKEFITRISKTSENGFVEQTNISIIKNANIQIFAKEKTLKEFIKKHI